MSDLAVLILGPTGTGKSLLALELALKLNASIVNTDSIQVYKDLIIGSAQPSREDFKIAPHYLYGYLPSGTGLTAAAYSADVEVLMRGKLKNQPVLFCGGSGFYIQALEKGMFEVPTLTEAQKQSVDRQLAEWGWETAHVELVKKDPNVKIHSNDHYRIRRAWEILAATGKSPSQTATNGDGAPLSGKNIIKIGLDLEKEILRKRIEQRMRNMLSSGWLDEVEALLEAGFREWNALKSVGYAEVVEFIDGKISRSEMQEKIVVSNMQLIKKQKTWFKRDPSIHWYSAADTSSAVKKVLSGSQ